MLMMAKPSEPVPPDLLLLTSGEVARVCNLGERTIWDLVAKREFPQPVKVGACTRWRRNEIEEWIRKLKAS
jgi:predicted DNA-binding transcriptional regulator AlpA